MTVEGLTMLLLLCMLFNALHAEVGQKIEEDLNKFRLPTSLYPKHYQLKIKTNLEERTLSGEVWIDILVKQKTNNITLHSKNLTLIKPFTSIKMLPNSKRSKNFDFNAKTLQRISIGTDTKNEDTNYNMSKLIESQRSLVEENENFQGNRKLLHSFPHIKSVKHMAVQPLGRFSSRKRKRRFLTDLYMSQSKSNNSQNRDHTKTIKQNQPESLSILSYKEDASKEFLEIYLSEYLQVGSTYRLFLKYHANLSSTLQGYYCFSYKDVDGSSKLVAATVFEPTLARRAYPCFDEPHFKASFQITLIHRNNESALSNMPLVESKNLINQKGWNESKFATSPLMSTYLAAWYVGNLETVEVIDKNQSFRIWGQAKTIHQSTFALNIAPKLFNALKEYMQTADSIPKTDLLALPSFISNALENWGLISFGEQYILYDTEMPSLNEQYNIANLLGHEFAHSWFGNSVTCRWWNDIWLNEGFATFFGNMALSKVKNAWQAENIQIIRSILTIFVLDTSKSTHSLRIFLKKPNEIPQIFDGITYNKGFLVLRMIQHILGEVEFRQFIINYFNSHKFGTANQESFLKVLDSNTKINNSRTSETPLYSVALKGWLEQKGYPVLTVIRNYNNNSAILTQERYILQIHPLHSKGANERWWLPITFTWRSKLNFSSTKPVLWFNSTNKEMQLSSLPGNNDWIIFNIQATGIYRVNYDLHNWKLLAEYLHSNEFSKIHILNRAQLIVDALDFAKNYLLPYREALYLTSYLKNDKEYLPWSAAFSNLNYLGNMLKDQEAKSYFNEFVQYLVEPSFNVLGFKADDNENLSDELNRELIIALACKHELPECVQVSTDLVQWWMESNGTQNMISANLQSVVYCTAVSHGGKEEWNFLWEQFKLASTSKEKFNILTALSCSKQHDILMRYASFTLKNSAEIKKSYSKKIFTALARADNGYNIIKEFINNNSLTKSFWNNRGIDFAPVITTLSEKMSEPDDIEKLIELKTLLLDDSTESSEKIRKAIQNVENNIIWKTNSRDVIVEWLKKHRRNFKENVKFY